MWKQHQRAPRKAEPGKPLTICQLEKGFKMFRKIALIAIPAMALLCVLGTDNSASNAFAKGGGMGKGGGISKFHGGYDRNFRHDGRYNWGRYNWNYRYGYGFGYVEPVVEVPVVAPVCATCEPAPVAPVCTTCQPVVGVVTPEYVSSWSYGKYNKFDRDRHHREQPLNRGGRK
jgi:hypothetical protein